jgi:hypothetical protein
MANDGAAAGDEAGATDDPLQFRPNPDALVGPNRPVSPYRFRAER